MHIRFPSNIITLFISFLFLSFSSSVNAAPQILRLVATAQPIPLSCADGVCKAEVTTVCLQEHRHAPAPGRAYKLGKGTEITLNILGVNGEKKVVLIQDEISIIARRHYTSVQISVPEQTLRKYGASRASIAVSAMASVVPVAISTDEIPLSAHEIEKYTGPLRQVARTVFDRDSVNVQTTQHLNQVINRLPDDYLDDKAQFEKSWAEVSNAKSRKQSTEVKRATNKIAQTCRYEFEVGKYVTLRSCLEQHHDVLASDTNKKVWKAMKPGG